MKVLMIANLVLFLGVGNWLILDKEHHLESGRRILLEVTRYDPRSLMQGDYMALNFPICTEINAQLDPGARGDGLAVVRVDDQDVGRFVRLHDPKQVLASDEVLLLYRIRWGRRQRVRVCAEEFFFQEGLAEEYEKARYAELRVTPAGGTLLVALRDADRIRIGGAK